MNSVVKFLRVWFGAGVAQAIILGCAVRNSRDIPETLVFSAISGCFCAGVCCWAYLFLADIWHKKIANRVPSIHWSVLSVVVGIASLCGLAVVATLLNKSLLGLLVVVGLGLVYASLLVGVYFAGAKEKKYFPRTLNFSLLVLAAIIYLRIPTNELPIVRGEINSVETIRVVSWNLGLGQPGSAASPKKYLPAVLHTLQELRPRVVLLQEVVSDDYVTELSMSLGEGWVGKRSRSEPGMITAALSDLPGEFLSPFPNAPYGGPAIFTWAAQPQVTFISIHLPPERSAEQRWKYASFLDNNLRTPTGRFVIGGDLNIDTDAFWDNASQVFTDSIETDGKTLEVLGRFGIDTGAGTAPTAVMSRRIDRLFASPSLRVQRFEVLKFKKQGRMDHDPIVLDLEIPLDK